MFYKHKKCHLTWLLLDDINNMYYTYSNNLITDELCLEAIKNNGLSLEFDPNDLITDELL
jgi:hypothetical protein